MPLAPCEAVPSRLPGIPSCIRQNERKEESTCKEKEKAEKAKEARKKLKEEIILKYLGTYIFTWIVEMLSERFAAEARSLCFFEGEL